MKEAFLIPLGLIALLAFAFTNPPNTLVGRWQKRLPDGTLGGAIFRSDSSFDGLINNKPFVSGKYYVRQDTFHIQDGACGNYYGVYKLTFVTADSIHFAVIQDRCQGRRQGNDGLTLGRVTPSQAK